MKIIWILLMITAGAAFAGDEAGNGGDVVVCFDDDRKITSVELLDIYEWRAIQGNSIDLGRGETTLEEKLEVVTKRVAKYSNSIANQLNAGFKTFFKESVFIEDIRLSDVPDSAHTAIPENCEIQQIAIQREPIFAGDWRYTINKNLWDRLDDNNKFGLILHELVYGKAITIEKPHANSIRARYFTTFLMSDEIDKITKIQFLDLLRRAKIYSYVNLDGYSVHRSSLWTERILTGEPLDFISFTYLKFEKPSKVVIGENTFEHVNNIYFEEFNREGKWGKVRNIDSYSKNVKLLIDGIYQNVTLARGTNSYPIYFKNNEPKFVKLDDSFITLKGTEYRITNINIKNKKVDSLKLSEWNTHQLFGSWFQGREDIILEFDENEVPFLMQITPATKFRLKRVFGPAKRFRELNYGKAYLIELNKDGKVKKSKIVKTRR